MKETTNGCHWRQRQLKSNRAIFPLIELSLDRSKPGWLVDQLEKNKHKDKRQQKIFLEHFVNAFSVLLIIIFSQKQAMLVRQLEDEVVKAKTHASQTNPEVRKNKIAHFLFQ